MAKKTKDAQGMTILVASGVNLDLLGKREPSVYGEGTLKDLEAYLNAQAGPLAAFCGVDKPTLKFLQSNHEGEFLEQLAGAWDGIILNAGAWTHTSLALADRLVALKIPFVEVHLSNLARREPFRHQSYAAQHALGVVYGLGFESYLCGLLALLKKN